MHTSAQWPLETQMAAMIASSMSYLKFLKMFRNSLTTKSHWCQMTYWTEFGQVLRAWSIERQLTQTKRSNFWNLAWLAHVAHKKSGPNWLDPLDLLNLSYTYFARTK